MTTITTHHQPPPPTDAARAALWGISLAAALLVTGGFSLGLHLPNLHNGLIAATFTAVGAFVLSKRPGHREGRLFLATGATHAVMFFCRQYGFASNTRALPAATWITWLGTWPLALILVLVGVTLMCFPDGRLPSRRWRPVVAAMIALGAGITLTSALWPVEYPDNSLATVPHPLHLPGLHTAQQTWNITGPAGYLLFQAAWVACVLIRIRRAHGDEARQLRWFAYAVLLSAAAMATGLAVYHSPLLGVLSVPFVALAAGIAIVKYRLYDIDPVLNKTLVIGAMAAVITAGYALIVVGIGGLVGTGPHPILSLAATALVALAFEPARRRVQRWADRLVYGDRPTPYEALARLSTQLNTSEDLLTGLATTVAEGVGATEVTLWVGTDHELVAMATWPPPATPTVTAPQALTTLTDGGRAHARPIAHQGTTRGAITLTKASGEALTTAENRLLDDLVAQAGLVLDHHGLTLELQHRLHQVATQAAELQAAAKRIVAAQYEARRRIERDLHDGAQQRLVTLALSLRTLAQHADGELATQVHHAQTQLTHALADLREMARGIHPAILTAEGLEAALGYLAERAPLPVSLDVHLPHRLPDDVEATAYFVVSEALTNAAKHAHATALHITGRLDEHRLHIDVTDDGNGGADGNWGSGLQGLVDRLATLGGRLTVHSPAGHGTHLQAVIPCA